jgi:transmembrane sensor
MRSAADEAAEWFVRSCSGEFGPEQCAALDAWLAARPENRSAFDHLSREWQALDAVRSHPDMLMLRENARTSAAAARRYRWYRPIFATAACAGVAAAVWWVAPKPSILRSAEPAPIVYETPVGQRSKIVLADGSDLDLDANSKVEVRYSARARAIDLLRGRAFFKVAKNAARPFVVTAGTLRVTAIGTRFDVDLRPASTHVMLAEGKVNIRQEGSDRKDSVSLVMSAGYQLTSEHSGLSLSRIDPRQAAEWLDGRLVFSNATLSDIVLEFNRYSPRPIVVDPGLANRRMSGVFAASNPAAFLDAAEALGLARASRTATAYVLSPLDGRP